MKPATLLSSRAGGLIHFPDAVEAAGSIPPRFRRLYGVLLVVGVAVALRLVGISTWSLWEDEEGSLTRSFESLTWGFQKYFPIFFAVLRTYAECFGLEVGTLRALPAGFGVLSIVLVMIGFRRQVTPGTALIAGLLLAVNFGHLFFSQSVRYYTTVLALQLVSLILFFDGFETGRRWKLALSLFAFVLALLTHFSALLLGPVFVGYLILTAYRGERGGGYRSSWYAGYGVALAAIGCVFTWRMLQLRTEFDGGLGAAIPQQRNAAYVGLNVLAYFGLPILGLGLLAPWLATNLPRRFRLLLLLTAALPVLELVVLASLRTVNVTWYYGFIGMAGFALLAAATITSLWTRGQQRLASILLVLAVGYHAAFLGVYYSTAHGDRPRWAEAAAWLKHETRAFEGRPDNPRVFSNVPGPVAFYLGVHPRQAEKTRFVQLLRDSLIQAPIAGWYVVEEKSLSAEWKTFFDNHCERRAQFEARTGPIDRSVSVYQYSPKHAEVPAH